MAKSWMESGRPGIRSRAIASVAMPEIETAHAAASVQARDMATTSTFRMSPDAALLPELDAISGRIDGLVRNNGVAAGAERTFVDNVIGPRIACKPNPDRIAIGRDAAWVADWSAQVESLFASFTDTDWFDSGLRYNFHVSTRLQARMIAATGEALALPLWTRRTGSKWRTCVQLVDPARLSNPMGRMDTPVFRGGIELDPVTTEATAYHIRKSHPGDFLGFGLMGAGPDQWERIPAYNTWGRRKVLHIFESERVGQTRGKAVISSVARLFNMQDKMMTEQLRLAVLNSLIFAALETPLDNEQINDIFDAGDGTRPMANYQDALNEWRVTMRGGAIVPLPPGTKMSAFAPTQQLTGLEAFTTTTLRSIGAGLNMPYELVFRDFSKSNYSSARAAMLEAWRYFASVRQFVIDHWCTAIFDLWFEEAVQRGMIPDCTPDDYYANQVAWTRCKWIFAGRGWIDPFKEARAAQIRMDTGVSTMADECAEQGRDWREQIEQQVREQAYRKAQYEANGLAWPPGETSPTDPAAVDAAIDAADAAEAAAQAA